MSGKMTIFAGIYIGTHEVSMKIFEISSKKKLQPIDYLKRKVEIGRDIYREKMISPETMDALCKTLSEFLKIMEGYRVTSYKAYGGPFLQDATNRFFFLDQLKQRTKIDVNVLSNSEHRFLTYKSIAARPEFNDYIHENAAVVDIGGNSVQMTLFMKGTLVTTQHMVIGTLRMKEKLSGKGKTLKKYKAEIRELVEKELEAFQRQYLQYEPLQYLIFMGDYCLDLIRSAGRDKTKTEIETDKVLKYLKQIDRLDTEAVAEELNLSTMADALLIPSLTMMQCVMEEMEPRQIYIPGGNISDGIAYDFAGKNHIFSITHDFEKDILDAAISLARRYNGFSAHNQAVMEYSEKIFDATKKLHGLGKRQKLMLKLAAILHDCGKYISFANSPDCSYQIIMSSEIMGLSHKEREMVASIVKYNVYEVEPYENLMDKLDQSSYIYVAKMAAILKVANALDRSHKQKCKDVKMLLKEKELAIMITAEEDIMMERSGMQAKEDAFETVMGVKPVLHIRRDW